jgi:enoyl-CoA hydratase
VADRYGFTTITTELDDGILTATLNRPDRYNALNEVMHHELRQLFGRIEADGDVRVVVLTGAGKAFCVGADFSTMQDNLDQGGYEDGHPSLFGDAASMARNILAIRQPMISAVNGDCIGLGATLALFCDIVLMADTARIADPHVKAGLVAGDGGAVLWPLLMGPNKAKEHLILGDLLSAADADRLGLTNHVVPRDELMAKAQEMARRIADGPQIAIRFNKRLVNKDLEERVSRLYDLSLAFEAVTFETEDHKEAVRSFIEKRPARFGAARG